MSIPYIRTVSADLLSKTELQQDEITWRESTSVSSGFNPTSREAGTAVPSIASLFVRVLHWGTCWLLCGFPIWAKLQMHMVHKRIIEALTFHLGYVNWWQSEPLKTISIHSLLIRQAKHRPGTRCALTHTHSAQQIRHPMNENWILCYGAAIPISYKCNCVWTNRFKFVAACLLVDLW
jgi:hypothetical protein